MVKGQRWAGLLVVLALLLAACGGGDSTAETPAGEAPAEAVASAVEQVTIQVGNELAYDPAELQIQDGTTLDVTMENTGALEHNIVWLDEESEPWLYTAGGETASNTRAFEAPGTYGFYCSIPGHREAGMVGEVTVLE